MRASVLRLCLLIASLIGTGPLARAQPHDVLRIGMAQFPPDMNPTITSTSVRTYILGAVARTVTTYAPDGAILCVLCTEVPTLANGRAKLVARPDGTKGMEVTFTLRPDLVWADGVPLTAKDIAFSFLVERTFGLISATVGNLEAVSDRDFKVTLTAPRYDFDRWTFTPLPEHVEGPVFRGAATPLEYAQHSIYNRRPEEPGLWFGPYRVAEFRSNTSVVLKPNEYWHGRKPAFGTVTMRLVENTAALEANLRAGDVDIVASGNLGITLDQTLALAKAEPDRFDLDFVPSLASYEHLTVQLDNPLLRDRRVRQAMQMAIDRRAIVTRVFAGKFVVADSFLSPEQFGWDPGVKTYPYDPAQARALLAQAGFKPGPDGILVSPEGARFSVDLVTTAGNRTRELIELVLQSQLRAVGIDIVIRNEPARTMFGETLRKRSFTGLVEFQSDLALSWVPDTIFHSRAIPTAETNWGGQNYTGFNNPDMDRAIDTATAAIEPDELRAAWKPMLAITANELPEINLFHPQQAILTPKWLTGVYQPSRWGFLTSWIEDWKPR